MDRDTFEKTLIEQGYTPMQRELDADLSVDEHDHAWDTMGLVLRGSFAVVSADRTQDCGPGDVFDLGAGILHTERTGPDGAELLVGRRAVGT